MEGDIEENKKSEFVAETNSKDDQKDTDEESVSAPTADNNDETGSSNVEDSNNNGNSQSNNSNGVVPAVAASPPPPQWAQMPYAGPVVPMSQQYQYAPPQYFPYSPQHPYCYYYDPIPYHQEPSPSQQPMGDGVEWSANYGGNRSLWVGDLEEWMDENYLMDCFAHTGEVSSVKVIRNRLSGRHLGYGFVEFVSHDAAERALWSHPWMRMPSTNQPFRLNWAMFSAANNKLSNNNNHGDSDGPDHSIFVGDLASDVTDSILLVTFSAKYPSAKAAKVVIDPNTGRSKGYGFVRFGDEGEMSKAMSEMKGIYCSTRPMRIGIATQRKKSSHFNSSPIKPESSSGGAASSHSDGDSANTTIFVGGLDPEVIGEDLKQPFAPYGEIISVKIPKSKGCGFVQFVNRNDAEKALQELNGTTIGKRIVRLAWGHSLSNNKQSNENWFGHGWATGAYYYGGPYYDGYGYPMHYHFMSS